MGCGVSAYAFLEEGSAKMVSIQNMALINFNDQDEIDYTNNEIPVFTVGDRSPYSDKIIISNSGLTSINNGIGSLHRKLNTYLVNDRENSQHSMHGVSSGFSIHSSTPSPKSPFGVIDAENDNKDRHNCRSFCHDDASDRGFTIKCYRPSPKTGKRSPDKVLSPKVKSRSPLATAIQTNTLRNVPVTSKQVTFSSEKSQSNSEEGGFGFEQNCVQDIEDMMSEADSNSADDNSGLLPFNARNSHFRTSLNLQINIFPEDEVGKSFKLISPDDEFDYDAAIAIPISPLALEELCDNRNISAKIITENCLDYPFKVHKNSDVMGVEVDGISLMIGANGIIEKGSDPESELFRLPMSERLVVLNQLGQGACSTVYKAIDLSSMQLVALKAIQIHEKGKRTQLVKEVCTLYQMMKKNCKIAMLRREQSNVSAHSNNYDAASPKMASSPRTDMENGYIVDFYDAFFNPEAGVVTLMLEFMDGGSLQNVVQRGGCKHEPTLASIAVQALKGVAFLHSCSQMHRDIKPGNFLISRTGAVKVADLGIAKKMDDPGIARAAFAARKLNKNSKSHKSGFGNSLKSMWLSSSKMIGAFSSSRRLINTELQMKHRKSLSRTNTFVGTVTYMSPERLDGSDYGYSCDVWSFGLSLMAVALGKFPMEANLASKKHGYWNTLEVIQDSVPQLPDGADYSPDFRNFLSHCLSFKADDRPTCRELMQHPFLKKAAESGKMKYALGTKEHGLEELRKIILAIYAHIKQIKNDYGGISKSWTTEQTSTLDRKVHQKVFGNVIEDSASQILQKVLFGRDVMHSLTPECSPSSVYCKENGRRPRLHVLAKQLNLPVEVAVKEARKVHEFLKTQEDSDRKESLGRSRWEFVPEWENSWGPESSSRDASSRSWVHALA